MAVPSAAAHLPRSLRILVVENHRDTLESMRIYLEMMDHVVFSAGTVAAALEILPEANCDVLISDIGLPDGNGWELLRRVRAQTTHPFHAIAMSGFGMGADQLKSQEAGFRLHLLKPFKPAELDDALADAMRELPARLSK